MHILSFPIQHGERQLVTHQEQRSRISLFFEISSDLTCGGCVVDKLEAEPSLCLGVQKQSEKEGVK